MCGKINAKVSDHLFIICAVLVDTFTNMKL